MTPSERRALRETYGLQWGTVEMICRSVKQLQRDGLTFAQVRRAVQNLHPKVMLNLSVDRDGTLAVRDKSFRWQRRHGWLSRWRRCLGCGSFLSPAEVHRGKCCRCIEYERFRATLKRQRRPNARLGSSSENQK